MRSLAQLSAVELLDGYRALAFTPLEVLDALAARIEELNPSLGAFTTLCLDRARDESQAAGERYRQGAPIGALDGVPLAVKDLYDTAGVRTTYGSAMFVEHVPTRDAELVRRARRAGAVVIGKSQTHEFAWGITSVNAAMGTARNPWDRSRVAGGSSGGSAVALAADLVPLALGSDTGGSIRIPSAFCGTVGLKPSYGLLSCEGIFPLAPSLDHAGPMARTPADVALLLAALLDPQSAAPAPLAPRLAGLRVGVCADLHPVRLQQRRRGGLRADARAGARGGRRARRARAAPRRRPDRGLQPHPARRGPAGPPPGGALPGTGRRVRAGRAPLARARDRGDARRPRRRDRGPRAAAQRPHRPLRRGGSPAHAGLRIGPDRDRRGASRALGRAGRPARARARLHGAAGPGGPARLRPARGLRRGRPPDRRPAERAARQRAAGAGRRRGAHGRERGAAGAPPEPGAALAERRAAG